MSKMTPGPWTLHIGETGYDGNFEIMQAVEGEHEANARAIAALPELLSAAHGLMNFLHAYPHPDAVDIQGFEQAMLDALEKSGYTE